MNLMEVSLNGYSDILSYSERVLSVFLHLNCSFLFFVDVQALLTGCYLQKVPMKLSQYRGSQFNTRKVYHLGHV